MKIIIVCILALLISSCRQTVNSSDSMDSNSKKDDVTTSVQTVNGYNSMDSNSIMKRNNRLSKIMDDYSKAGNPYYMKYEYEFEGPLNIAQVEEKLIKSYNESSKRRREIYGVIEKFEDSDAGEAWAQIKSKYRDGDELYFYKGIAKPSWSRYAGYVLIRENNVVAKIVTSMG
jgi:hypothetical protein